LKATSAQSGGRRSAQDRRARIITAARSLFAQQGFHNTGMAQIARVSDVLVGQIYRDFASKEDLIAAIVEQDVSGLLHDPELPCTSDATAHDDLIAWVRKFVCRKFDEETRRVLADILSEGTRNPRMADILTAAHHRLRESLVGAIAVWAPDPGKRAACEVLADLILTVEGAITHRQIVGLHSGCMVEARMMEMIEMQIEDLRSQA